MNEKGRHRWFAMSRPSMLPLKYRTLRTRSHTKLNGRPVSSAVLGAGGSAIGLEAGAETGAITAIGADCVTARFDVPGRVTDCHTTVPGTLLVRLEAMAVPLDQGALDRRRLGPFWIEEGPVALVAGAAIVLLFAALFILAVAMRPA